MKIIITQWALDSNLDLKHKEVFTNEYFREIIKPDVMLLINYPNDAKFANGKFWSQAGFKGNIIPHGFKMKWHQVGNGKMQLRLPVVVMKNIYLCGAYIKNNEKTEKRMLAKFKTHLQLIQEGKYIKCGELS